MSSGFEIKSSEPGMFWYSQVWCTHNTDIFCFLFFFLEGNPFQNNCPKLDIYFQRLYRESSGLYAFTRNWTLLDTLFLYNLQSSFKGYLCQIILCYYYFK